MTESELLSTGGDAQVIVDTAREGAQVEQLRQDGLLVTFAVPAGVQLESRDFEREYTFPWRKRGQLVHHTGASLGRYVEAHRESGATALYADVETRRVVAILNDHTEGENAAGWADHRATLALRHSPEWKAWAARDGRLGDQTDFAAHVDERLPDIIEPPGADLLELVQSFQAHNNVAFRSAIRLDSGETQLRYEETVDAKAGRAGDMTIPAEFTLALRPFEGTDPVDVRARLRYRVRDGALAIGYQLVRPEDIIRVVFDQVLEEIEAETGIEAYRGAAPEPRQ